MPHIHTNPGEHDATVSALIIRFDTPEPQLLLHMHKKLHKIMQPGGHVELTETPWQAILHEITEETGYEIDQLRIMQPKERLYIPEMGRSVMHPLPLCENTHPVGDAHFHTDRTYVFAADAAPRNLPGDGESTQLEWRTADQLARLTDEQTFPELRDIGRYALEVCAKTWERVTLSEFQA